MSNCFGWFEDDTVPEAEESDDVDGIEISCTEDKIMYVHPQEDGFLLVRDETGGKNQSLPQFLKVKVIGSKSCTGSRYHFEILEGPLVKKAVHWDVRSKKNEWSVVKIFKGKSTLDEKNPHIAPFAINVDFTGMSHRGDDSDGTVDGIRTASSSSHGDIAVASLKGDLTFKGKTTNVVMELDIIPPNTKVKVAIPDTIHPGARKYTKDVPKAMLWMRIDAPTSAVDWKAGAAGADRYLHFGKGSAGCFTNRPETQSEWNAIIDDLSKSRTSVDGLYVGTIQFNIDAAKYAAIEAKLKAYAKKKKLKYIWDNKVKTP